MSTSRRPGGALSLRTRLIAGIVFVAAVLAGVLTIVTVSIRSRLIDQVDERLTALSPAARAGAITPNPPIDLSELRDDLAGAANTPPVGIGTRVSDVYQGVISPDGELITIFTPNIAGDEYPPPVIDPVAVGDRLPMITTLTDAEEDVTYRVLLQPLGDVVGVTAVPIDDVQATITTLILVEVLGSLAILAALGIVGWWVVHLGIRPIKDMTRSAAKIAGGDLSARVPEPRHGTEAGELANALNTMLGRIETALADRAASEDRLRRFVSDASHELRTPVTSIRGYAELYRVGALPEGPSLDDAMRRTEQEATRIGRLVDDMLTLARYDEHRPMKMAPVDIAQLARDGADDARATDPHRQIEVRTPNSPATVIGDEDRLRQVIANTITNALVHTPPDTHVAVSVERRPSSVIIDVTDRGPGMEPAVVARVTERFYRADPSRSRHSGGSGLGLSIVEAVVSAHGGSVEIRSTPGEGTTVRLELPRAPSPPDEPR